MVRYQKILKRSVLFLPVFFLKQYFLVNCFQIEDLGEYRSIFGRTPYLNSRNASTAAKATTEVEEEEENVMNN